MIGAMLVDFLLAQLRIQDHPKNDQPYIKDIFSEQREAAHEQYSGHREASDVHFEPV